MSNLKCEDDILNEHRVDINREKYDVYKMYMDSIIRLDKHLQIYRIIDEMMGLYTDMDACKSSLAKSLIQNKIDDLMKQLWSYRVFGESTVEQIYQDLGTKEKEKDNDK